MADTLRHGAGHNSDYTRDQYLGFIDQYTDADRIVADAVAARKDLRAKIKSSGIPLAAFDRTRRDMQKSGQKRLDEENHYQKMMAFLGMPVGFQSDIFSPEAAGSRVDQDIDQNQPNEMQLRRVKDAGYGAGKGGDNRTVNPWNPGSLLYQTFDEAWIEGQASIAKSMAPDAAPKRRGRPPGSGKKNEAPAAVEPANEHGDEPVLMD